MFSAIGTSETALRENTNKATLPVHPSRYPSIYLLLLFPKPGCRVSVVSLHYEVTRKTSGLSFYKCRLATLTGLTPTRPFSPRLSLPPPLSSPPAASAEPPSAQGPPARRACSSRLSRRTCAPSAQHRRAPRSFTVLSAFGQANELWQSSRGTGVSAERSSGASVDSVGTYVGRVREVWVTPVASSSRCCFLDTRSWEDISSSNWVSSCFLHTALSKKSIRRSIRESLYKNVRMRADEMMVRCADGS